MPEPEHPASLDADGNAALQDFLRTVSHDLREPLRHVISFAEILQMEEAERLSEDGQAHLASIITAGMRLHGMLAGLLELSRVFTTGQPMIPCDPAELIASEIRALEAQHEHRQLALEMPTLPAVCGDPNQLRRLFREIIGNALAFSDPASPLHITITPYAGTEGRAGLKIEDDGPGFDPAFAETVFAVFQRLGNSPTTNEPANQGLGIGLALCRRICERHTGSISAQSAPGSGTGILVELPRAAGNG